MKALIDNRFYLLLVLLFSILGMKALFHPGLFTAHDIWHQVARLYHYSEAVNSGQFPPYWISTLANGFGYPLFFFSYHLPWLLGLPFLKLGIDIPDTLKILFFISYVFSGIFMYTFVNNLLKNRLAATLSAIIYLWSPYHFLTTFVGASMGIVFVFTFLPLLFLGLHLIAEQKNVGIPITAIGMAGIVLSHLMQIIFLAPVILTFVLWEIFNSKKRFVYIQKLIFSFILGIFLSAFYLIPAVYYNKFTKVSLESGLGDLYKRNFVNLSQIIYSKWGYGPIVNNAKNGEMSVQLGFAQWFSVIGILLLLLQRKIKKPYKYLSIFTLTGFLISIFLMLDISLPVWQFIEKFITLDYPFRELLGATFLGSLSAGIIIINLKGNIRKLFFIAIIFIALYTNKNHIRVNLYTEIPLKTYIDSEITTNSFGEYLPLSADSKLFDKQQMIAEGTDLEISNLRQSDSSLSLIINAPIETNVSLSQFSFPGQKLFIDQKLTDYGVDQHGRINFESPSGSHEITVRFEDTEIIKFSKILTIIGIILCSLIFLKQFISLKKTSYS